MSRPIRVLIVDDHPFVLRGIKGFLSHVDDIKVVAAGTNGREAVDMYAEHQPDVTILDLRLPVMDGIQALQEIRAANPAARVMMLTTFDDEEDVYRAVSAGARGYILKETPPEELALAIRCVFAEQRYLPSPVSSKLADRIGKSGLTVREVAVLRLAARGFSNKRIAAELRIATGTVKGHLETILVKLGAGDRTEAVTIALRRGLLRLDRL